MITGNACVLDDAVIDIAFDTKPLVIGGLAMAYYGLRKRGADIDLIIADKDYQALAKKYPQNKMDRWGDLAVSIGSFQLLRSIYRLDYDFYAQGAIEHEKLRVVSFEKFLFMKALAFWSQPEPPKHGDDFTLVMNRYLGAHQNAAYVENAMKHVAAYQAVPNGIVLNDGY